ncbi:magnesium transporter [Desulfovibrio sp. TomC]|uniref:magnesium transporter n=1 Tax=Desulfovibrio sp. TomC TaxID=1562888 RepID=UPI0005746FEE|nr:CBS domain-containing protein [Desulfovibrio sp. TomC]KHK01362.1 Mg/Co/Ni transporter MgtE / CBS domain [Desulfovibrio sp. TomC]
MNELYVSAVLGRPVIDPSGVELGRLTDLGLVPGKTLPVVSGLFIRSGGRRRFVPWSCVNLFTPVIVSADLSGEADSDTSWTEDEETGAITDIRLRRDILDRQIVDVDGAKVVRVNDLKLHSRGKSLFIEAVDVGIRGMARRLGQLRFWNWLAKSLGVTLPTREIDWRFVAQLDPNADKLTLTVARERLTDMHPADIAEILAQLPHKEAGTVIGALDPETVGEAIGELDPEVGGRVISQLDSEMASDILEEMEPDEAADLLADLPEEKVRELLGLMDTEDAEMVQELLEHEEDTAGGLMNNMFAFVPPAMTAEEALNYIRLVGAEIENVYYVYVIRADETPLGVVTLKRLLLSPPKTPVAEIMTVGLKAVGVEDTPGKVMDIISKYNLLAVPVLDDGHMVGIVQADAVIERFLPESVTRTRFAAH